MCDVKTRRRNELMNELWVVPTGGGWLAGWGKARENGDARFCGTWPSVLTLCCTSIHILRVGLESCGGDSLLQLSVREPQPAPAQLSWRQSIGWPEGREGLHAQEAVLEIGSASGDKV